MGCGIGGVSTNYTFREKEAEICFRILDSLQRRGTDAWGYFDGTQVYKEPGAFEESAKYDTLMDDLLGAETNVFLCHTRRATTGSPEYNPNNHPFTLSGFVFAHNGVLYYTDEFENVWGVETDSFWMLYWIWKEYQRLGDVREAIKAGVEHVAGTYACWLWKQTERRIYLYRTKNRVMETSFWRGKNITVFGSDWLSIVNGFGIGGLARRFRFMVPDIEVIKPRTIYMIKDGMLTKDGRFRPTHLPLIQLQDFERRYGDLLRYHAPLVSGEGIKR